MTRRGFRSPSRHGFITPLLAIALLVVLACTALALDRLWIELAMTELTTCAEAAAIAAGRELAADELLRAEADAKNRLAAARRAAAHIAAQNLVAGKPLQLETSPAGDIRFGRLVVDEATGRPRFVETTRNPTSVLVTARRSRSRNNPVALLFSGLTGGRGAEAAQRAEATIDNRVAGVRPFGEIPVPALPLAILKHDPAGTRADTWDVQIERRAGQDRFSYDARSRQVQRRPDGIPEIVLRSMKASRRAAEANVLLVELGTDLRSRHVVRQIRRGWTVEDLADYNGELTFQERPLSLIATAAFAGDVPRALAATAGQTRIVLLYAEQEPVGRAGLGRARCVGLVAGRVMTVRVLDEGACEIVFQPAVTTSRTAVLADISPPHSERGELRNPYIYKLQLTY